MTRRAKLRRRVLRIVQGEYRPEDFSRLLLWLRDRSFGVYTIQELGDFVAHSDTRIKGPLTDETNACFTTIRARVRHSCFLLDLSDLPHDILDLARINITRFDRASLKRETELTRRAAAEIVDSLASRLVKQANGRCAIRGPLTDREAHLLTLGRSVVIKPIFDDYTLLRDFIFVMEKNGLAISQEKKALRSARAGLALHALEAMHLTQLRTDTFVGNALCRCH